MRLEEIGFYTLSDARAAGVSATSPMMRCEALITDRCNFACPYCRGSGSAGDEPIGGIIDVINLWADDGLQNIRFSGGEPTLHPGLEAMVKAAWSRKVQRIAVSSNGSADFELYWRLVKAGVSDFSISLDGCCAATGEKMAGRSGMWDKVCSNIRALSELVYVTVGVVITEANLSEFVDTVVLAHELGVDDIRIISAAQYNMAMDAAGAIPQQVVDAHPILLYRVNNYLAGRNVRGIRSRDSHKCSLVLDDSVTRDGKHYPCVIHLREGGEAIGMVGPNMRAERVAWFEEHDTHSDPICSQNCLDICIDYNNKADA